MTILKDTDGLIKRRLKVIALAPVFAACIPVGAAIGLFRPLIDTIRAVAADCKVGWRVVCQILREMWAEAAELEKYGPKEAAADVAAATAAASKAAAAKTSSAARKAWRGMFIGSNDSTALARFKLACLILPAGSVFCAKALYRALLEVTRGAKEAWNHTPRGR